MTLDELKQDKKSKGEAYYEIMWESEQRRHSAHVKADKLVCDEFKDRLQKSFDAYLTADAIYRNSVGGYNNEA